MANKIEQCKPCPYNIPKTRGGYGRMCNGITQQRDNRCPEWRINELKEDCTGNRELLRTLACPPWERKFFA